MKMHLKSTLSTILFFLALGAVFSFVTSSHAQSISYGRIISDFEFFDYSSMSQKGIQNFLASQPGTLSTSTFSTSTGTKSTAEIIYLAAQEYKISPKVILVTLQKEQSLIRDPAPSQRAYDYALGYGCPDGNSCNAKTAGFFKQIDYTTWQFRKYSEFPSQYSYQIRKTYTIDNAKVLIENQATANLYNFTPHLHGNELFYYWWSQWFKLLYPDGTLLRVKGEPGVSVIVNGTRQGFSSSLAMISRGYNPQNIMVVTKDEVEKYAVGKSIDFPNHSLVQNEDGRQYLLDGLTKRLIPSQDVFDNLGFHKEEVIITTSAKLEAFSDGSPLAASDSYPTGILVQNKNNGAIGYVKDGVLHGLVSKDILYNQFPRGTWIRISPDEFTGFPQGDPVKLKDGTLVRSPKYKAGVFIISNGERRLFPSRAMFNALGYKMKNVLKINDKSMDLHPEGSPIGS